MTAWVPTIKSVNEPLAPCFTVTTSPVSINEPGTTATERSIVHDGSTTGTARKFRREPPRSGTTLGKAEARPVKKPPLDFNAASGYAGFERQIAQTRRREPAGLDRYSNNVASRP